MRSCYHPHSLVASVETSTMDNYDYRELFSLAPVSIDVHLLPLVLAVGVLDGLEQRRELGAEEAGVQLKRGLYALKDVCAKCW